MSNDRGRIVVGVDGSPASREALAWAARQAELIGARLDVVMTWNWPSVIGGPVSWPDDFNPENDARQVVQELVHDVLGSDPAVEVHAEVLEGNAATSLLEAARGASLLVVGTRGHGPFSGMLIGSVSQHCVTQAPCSVVVVHPVEHHVHEAERHVA